MWKPAVGGVLKSQHPFLKKARLEVQGHRRPGLGLGGSPVHMPTANGAKTRPLLLPGHGLCQPNLALSIVFTDTQGSPGCRPAGGDPGCPALTESTARGAGRHQSSDCTQGHTMNIGGLFYATGARLSGCEVHPHGSLDDLRLVPVLASLRVGTEPRADSCSEGRFLWNPIGTGRREGEAGRPAPPGANA